MYQNRIASKSDAFADTLQLLGFTAYPEQVAMSSNLSSVRDRGGVGFIEAPTATGKTLVIAEHVVRHVAETRERYVIAVPTIELGHQTLASIRRVQESSQAFSVTKATIVLGRQEFISEASLLDLANILQSSQKAAAAEAIRTWLEDGAPGRTESHPAYTLDGLERWLDARGIAESVSAVLALGPSDKNTAADLAYQAQFVDDADIFIVTHAMLARDLVARFIATSRQRHAENMTVPAHLTGADRWLCLNNQRLLCETGDEGRLPDYRRLIVDEAHLLRDNFDTALRTGISLTALLRHVESLSKSSKKPVPAAAKKAVKEVRDALSRHVDAHGGDRIQINWSQPGNYADLLEKLDSALGTIKTNKAPEFESEVAAISQARHAIKESLRARSAVSTIFEWSPVAAFPTISIGRRHFLSEFGFLWNRLDSAALISATLYTENVGGPSIGYMAARLAVPADKRREFKPIRANWIKKPVSLILDKDEPIIPSDDPAGRSEWLDTLAKRITELASDATGTLVLNTRRDDSRQLAVRLADLVDPIRIIDGTTGRMSALKQAYIRAARDQLSPIWLGQGPAWTGLDLPDDTLDLLIMTRLPFPPPDARDTANETSSFYGADKIAKMAMTFKQGVGRLVRVRDAKPKRFALLDSRVLTLKNTRGIVHYLSDYRSFPREKLS